MIDEDDRSLGRNETPNRREAGFDLAVAPKVDDQNRNQVITLSWGDAYERNIPDRQIDRNSQADFELTLGLVPAS